MTSSAKTDLDAAHALGEVRGQLTSITLLLQAQHEASNRRMDDLQKSIDNRFDSLENRIGTLEQNERGTAIKAAASGAGAAGLTILLTEVVKGFLFKGGA
jgi:hypothetical protein